jgi:hypothetical protein
MDWGVATKDMVKKENPATLNAEPGDLEAGAAVFS